MGHEELGCLKCLIISAFEADADAEKLRQRAASFIEQNQYEAARLAMIAALDQIDLANEKTDQVLQAALQGYLPTNKDHTH